MRSSAEIARCRSATTASASSRSALPLNSATSRPEEKALPSPVTSTALTRESAAAVAAADSSSAKVPRSMAFSFSGRARVIVATCICPSTS
jgi:hypothetical protein